jgi:hypothetical protein
MNSRIFWIIVGLQTFIGLGCIVYANSFLPFHKDADGLRLLNKELEEKFASPNRWGYSIWYYPSLTNIGLTYLVSSNFFLQNQRYKSVDEAQSLFIDIYKDYINKLNSIREIRPFLAEFPITPSSTSLCLVFKDSKRENLQPPYIVSVILRWDALEFNQCVVGDEFELGFEFRTICKREIKKISGLNELYSPSIPRNRPTHPIKMVAISKPFPATPDALSLFHFISNFAEQKNLHFVTFNSVGETIQEFWPFQFALYGYQNLKLEEARVMAAQCSTQTLQFLKSDKECLDFMKKRSTWRHIKDKALIPEIQHFAFRISFWDESIDRQPQPYIAEIRFLGGKVKYYSADENQRLVLVFEETLDDVQKYLKIASTVDEGNAPNED